MIVFQVSFQTYPNLMLSIDKTRCEQNNLSTCVIYDILLHILLLSFDFLRRRKTCSDPYLSPRSFSFPLSCRKNFFIVLEVITICRGWWWRRDDNLGTKSHNFEKKRRQRRDEMEKFLVSFSFLSWRHPFISGKAHQCGILDFFCSIVSLPSTIQMFCDENCFIANEWEGGSQMINEMCNVTEWHEFYSMEKRIFPINSLPTFRLTYF